jgi:hypothetical protein
MTHIGDRMLQVHRTAGAFGGSMLRPSRWRRPVRTSPLLSSKARESGRVSSQAEAGRQAQLSRCARTPSLHAVGVVRREERLETGLGLVPCEDAFGLGDVAQAPGVDLHQLGLPEVSRFAV